MQWVFNIAAGIDALFLIGFIVSAIAFAIFDKADDYYRMDIAQNAAAIFNLLMYIGGYAVAVIFVCANFYGW